MVVTTGTRAAALCGIHMLACHHLCLSIVSEALGLTPRLWPLQYLEASDFRVLLVLKFLMPA